MNVMSLDEIIEKYYADPLMAAEVARFNGHHYEAEVIEARTTGKPEPMPLETQPLSTWPVLETATARAESSYEWNIKTDTREEWRARRWFRQPWGDRKYLWQEGTIDSFLIKREVGTHRFKRDQYDYVIQPLIAQLDWDPVEFWRKGTYNQRHDVCGASNGKIMIVCTQKRLYACPIDKNGQWKITSETPTHEYDRLDVSILDVLGL